MAVALRGAGGVLGRRVAAELGRRGVPVRPLGPGAALAEEGIVVPLVPGGPDLQRARLEAALERGADVVAAVLHPEVLRWALDEVDEPARAAGRCLLPAAGLVPLVGDALVGVAAAGRPPPVQAHVAYAVPERGGPWRRLSAGTRIDLAARLGRPATALVDGRERVERPGEVRRLAWFPRPVGPHHAVGVAGCEPRTAPRHHPSLRTVRTYLAMSSWRAEGLQMAANAARWPTPRRWLRSWLARSGPAGEPPRGTRWACVAEVAGPDGVGRAWAYGRDPYGTAAVGLAVVCERVVAGRVPAGVCSPGELGTPGRLLDAVAADTDLRWSVVRPDAGPTP